MSIGACGDLELQDLQVSVREEKRTAHYKRLRVTFNEVRTTKHPYFYIKIARIASVHWESIVYSWRLLALSCLFDDGYHVPRNDSMATTCISRPRVLQLQLSWRLPSGREKVFLIQLCSPTSIRELSPSWRSQGPISLLSMTGESLVTHYNIIIQKKFG